MSSSGNVPKRNIIITLNNLTLDNENHNWQEPPPNSHIHYLSAIYHTLKNTGQVSTTCLMWAYLFSSYSVSHRISAECSPDFSTMSVRKPLAVGSFSVLLGLSLLYGFHVALNNSHTAADCEEAIPSVLAEAQLPVQSSKQLSRELRSRNQASRYQPQHSHNSPYRAVK